MKTQMVIGVILAVVLTQIPIIGRYFSVVNTLIHESGHSLMALLTGGEVRRISLFASTEGATMTAHRSWLSQVLTSASGYVFSSVIAFLLFYLIYKGHSHIVIYILLGFLAINLVFWVRNVYGIFWLVTFGAGFIWMLRSGHETVIQYVLVFIASLLFVKAITSAFEIMVLSFISPHQAGDATNLAQATWMLPAQVWGILFFLQSLYFGWLTIKKIWL
ncbi:M50 family metallopeptidase [Thalassobacillus sp. CUG 92003]|uniref:M50 family metallopeptidase n=1 Tax=Thalassobacillus sp. CUG 92003 TaxID=2736641 RepID=UPI0015E702C2|nr:M50 family metallopeptidase [Thalassobacillus sp. CUG 92003]